jgi:predicted permease
MMTTHLKIVFALFLLAIVAVTSWAGTHVAIWDTPREVVTHPWFIATLTDTYLAFLTFWLWVAYKETSWTARLAWLVLICLTGNMAMAAYVLMQLWRLPRGASVEQLLLRRA